MNEGTTHQVAVFVEPTPNPNSLKFIVGRTIVATGSYEFSTAEQAAESALARRLFEIPGVDGVFVGVNFVSVRKVTETTWDTIEPEATRIIEEEVSSGHPVVSERAAQAVEPKSEAEATIRRILDEEVRPAIAGDGGDVDFQSFENGVLTLRLIGACSGCPSSLMTLKMGIERRLKEDVPELTEVISTT